MGAELANTEISKGTERKVGETPHLETAGERGKERQVQQPRAWMKIQLCELGNSRSGGPPFQPSRPAFGLDPGFKVNLKSIGAGLLASRRMVSGRPDERSLSSEFLIIGF